MILLSIKDGRKVKFVQNVKLKNEFLNLIKIQIQKII